MKVKKFIPIITSVILAVVLVIMACNQAVTPTPSTTTKPAATPTATPISTPSPTPTVVVQDKKYNVLNPQGDFAPVQTKPLAARLDTLDGKTIWVCQSEADPVIMPALWDRLKQTYTKTTWMQTVTSSTAPVRLTADQQKTAQAVIIGNAW